MAKREQEKAAESAPPRTIGEILAATSPAQKPLTPRNLFSHPETHPVVLDMALLKKFGVDWFPWLTDTLFFEIEREFNTHIAEANRLKILAARTLHMNDAFWDQWEVFEKVVSAINNVVPRLDTMQPPDLPGLMHAIEVVSMIRQEEYGDEVKRYCAAVFLHENVHYAPPPLAFCQEYISQPLYKCRDCDRSGSALPPFDGHCPTCTQKFEQDKAFSLKPDPEMKDKTKGDKIDYRLTYNPAPVRERFEAFDKMSPQALPDAIDETKADDIEAAQLIIAVDYARYRQGQLKTQLEVLRGWLGAS